MVDSYVYLVVQGAQVVLSPPSGHVLHPNQDVLASQTLLLNLKVEEQHQKW